MTKLDLNLDYNFRPSNLGVEGSTAIFLIHGYGADKNDLFSFANYLPVNLSVFALQAPYSMPYGGAAWYSLEMAGDSLISDRNQALSSLQKIDDFIDQAVEKYNLNAKSKFVLGFSQGGILSCGLALNKPEKYRYMLPLSAYIYDGIMPENFDKDYSQLDFYSAHGTMDGVIPIEKGRSVPKMLENLKIKHKYSEFAAGHSIAQAEFEELIQWIKDRM